MEDKREFAQENEKLRDESAALVKLCENLKKELRNAELTIAALKEQVSPCFFFWLKQLKVHWYCRKILYVMQGKGRK